MKKSIAAAPLLAVLFLAVPALGEDAAPETPAEQTEPAENGIPAELTDSIEKEISAEVAGTTSVVSNYPGYPSLDAGDDPLPASFDLRDKGVVTSVKLQYPFGTCWAFGTMAACESSILTKLGMTCDEFAEKYGYPMDLSEKQAVYFVHHALPETDAQGGEGNHYVNQFSNPEMDGGESIQAGELFLSGVGPAFEHEIPYKGKEGLTADETNSRGSLVHCYSKEDDWTLPEDQRAVCDFDLTDCSELISPAYYDANGTYYYNPYGTYDIKRALYQGHSVAIAFCADNSMPGKPTTTAFMNASGENPPWAHYTYMSVVSNHVVCIVGWDDDYPASNFTEGHRPPADGAWIVKNSWGSLNSDEMNYCDWGYQGSGYFYLSYYDKTIGYPTIFDFDVSRFLGTGSAYTVAQYDGVMVSQPSCVRYDDSVMYANVFTAEKDSSLAAITLRTGDYNTTAAYQIWRLNADAKDPQDGTLLETKSVKMEHAGLHRIVLDHPFTVAAGERIAVVAFNLYGKADGTQACSVPFNFGFNLNYALDSSDPADPEGYNIMSYDSTVLNPGESFVRYDGTWYDLTDIENALKEKGGNCRCADLDNFTLKAYFTE